MSSEPGAGHIIIVSRDGDFGSTHDDETFINDWLRLEFKERISRRRKIELTNRLSTALKRLSVNISKDDVAAENKIVSISEMFRSGANTSFPPGFKFTFRDNSELRVMSDALRAILKVSASDPDSMTET